MSRQAADAGGCYGPGKVAIVARGSCWRRGSLWTVPELWKTHRTRFPQLLGRRRERAAHNGPQAFFSRLKREEQEPIQ